eukprot:gene29020-35029_t
MCKGDTPEQAARREELKAECSRELLYAALPVFVAASISNFITSLIEYIAEDAEDPEAIEISLSVVVALLLYVYGKYFTWLMVGTPPVGDGEKASCSQNIKTLLERYNMLNPVLRVASENSGFIIKDFMVQLLLNTVYKDQGFGATFGLWLLCVVMCTTAIQGAAYLHKSAGFGPEQQARLLHYDCDAFCLGVAYVLTALLAQGSAKAGFRYISSSSYIYSYEDDHDDNPSGTDNSYLYLYFVVGTLVVGAVLMAEEYAGIQLRVIKDESAAVSEEEVEIMVRDATVEYRHNVYGLVTWRGPPFLASMMLRYEQEMRYLQFKRSRAAAQEANNRPKTCWDYLTIVNDWYIQLGISRRMVCIAALKLSLGWVWEIVVGLVFDILSGTGRGRGLKLVLRLAGMAVVCLVSVGVIQVQVQREAAQGNGEQAEAGPPDGNRGVDRQANAAGTVNPLASGANVDNNMR